MNNIYRYLGCTATTILTILGLTSCSQIRACEIQDKNSHKVSVQSNNSIYSKIFGSKRCSPPKIILRVPVNSKAENQGEKDSSSIQPYTPNIMTLVTFSREYKSFYVRRIDQYKDDFFYTKKDSCVAWKWSEDNEQQVLNLSMDRNLQIRDRDIKSVIFIISLPVEIKEAKTKIILKRYVLDRLGDKYKLNFKKIYPILKGTLRQKERQNTKASDAFVDGRKVNNEIAKELAIISQKGGVHMDEDFESALDSEQVEKYTPSAESPACEIPEDLKNLADKS
jgi:hypothetical protein